MWQHSLESYIREIWYKKDVATLSWNHTSHSAFHFIMHIIGIYCESQLMEWSIVTVNIWRTSITAQTVGCACWHQHMMIYQCWTCRWRVIWGMKQWEHANYLGRARVVSRDKGDRQFHLPWLVALNSEPHSVLLSRMQFWKLMPKIENQILLLYTHIIIISYQ